MKKQERKDRDKEEQRRRILAAADEIVAREGVNQLSIRKIAAQMDYSPGIIYHYFQSKEDLIDQLMQEGYRKIVAVLRAVDVPENQPERLLQESLLRYIEIALERDNEYKHILLNDSPHVLNRTSVLFPGAAEKREAIGMLSRCLSSFDSMRDKNKEQVELTAQMIWSATFGLIIRMIIEKDQLTAEQKQKLIDHHLEWVNRSIALA